jgi:hypothetical protein
MAFTGFGGFNRANQAAILQQQVSDQLQAQSIMRQIAQQKQAFDAGHFIGPQGPQQPQFQPTQRPPQMNFMQLSHVLNTLMQVMMSIAQLGNGFSSFMGGGPAYPQAQRY